MKITKTEMTMKIGNGSSYKVYLCKTREDASSIHSLAMSLKPEETLHEWYYAVHTSEANFCLIPDFFHDHGYFATVVEHNNGDWDKAPKYELYIVE